MQSNRVKLVVLSAFALFLLAAILAGCGSSSGSSTSSSTAGGASEAEGSSETAASSESEGSGETEASDPVVQEAKEEIEEATGPTTEWKGPASGPKGAKDKSIACVTEQATDINSKLWCQGVEEAAQKLGWKYAIFNGEGTPSSQRSAIQSALALNPQGIVFVGLEPMSQSALTDEAASKGIPMVGIHAVADPGPAPEQHLFYNISQDPKTEARTGADMAIANSDGTAEFIEITDLTYPIAREKAKVAKERIEECSGCTFLKEENSPFANAETNMGPLFNSYLQTYPEPFYVFAVSDFYLDNAAPALRAAGIPKEGRVSLIGSDGSPAAFERIKNGEFELGTVAEPVLEQGWQAADELNRAFAGEKPSGYVQSTHVLTKENIDADTVGDHFEPHNEFRKHYEEIWGVG